MLHDVGKICLRAKGEGKNYADLGADFLEQFVENSDEDQQLLRCVRYHYADDLEAENLAPNDLAYIVSEANVIASGTDKIEKEEYNPSKFNPALRLANIFNRFKSLTRSPGNGSYFSLQVLEDAKISNLLESNNSEAPETTQSNYSRLLKLLEESFLKCKLADMHPNELLRILEDTVLYVPSRTGIYDSLDVSLYDHCKITAAVASSLLRHFNNHRADYSDYKDFCSTNAKKNRVKQTMLFVSGDFSGIQSFIYRAQTKGALRMLRGRSFYLDMVLENVIDEILEKLSLSRTNLIYSGGGHFYLLADNSQETIDILTDVFRKINRKLAEMFSGSLYLAFAWEEICADDLMEHKTKREKNIFQKVGEKLSIAKLHRYDKDTLPELFDANSQLNLTRKGSKECGLCHRSVSESNLRPYRAQDKYRKGNRLAQVNDDEENIVDVCDICNGLYKLGEDILGDLDAPKALFAVVNGDAKVPEYSVEIPSSAGKRYLTAVSEQELEKYHKDGSLIRVYAKNQSSLSEQLATRLWVGDFAAEEDGKVIDLNDLADKSGGEKSEKGIERLGVLRADVDNLGAAFITGLQRSNPGNSNFNPYRYATLTRYSALSRQLSMFFKKFIVDVCRKQLPEGQEPFYMFRNKDNAERLVHIIYSGGDDIFVVGAWDDLLEFAVDLRKAFKFYTNGKLSFSGGLGLFTSTYPIRLMADITGSLEDVAKDQKATGRDGKEHYVKDSIALFGESTEYINVEKKEETPVFRWKDFEENVCCGNEENDCIGKLRFLLDHFAMEGLTEDTEDTGKKLKVGKSLLYRLLVLLSAPRFNLARFAYALARLEPGNKNEERKECYNEVREQLFIWSRKEDNRKQLVTAIRLVIYIIRDKQEGQ